MAALVRLFCTYPQKYTFNKVALTCCAKLVLIVGLLGLRMTPVHFQLFVDCMFINVYLFYLV